MADESFPLPGSSYKQIEKIITSYAELNTESGPAEVAQLAGTDSTNVSRNNRFLVAVGIIEGRQKKIITALGRELARAIRFDKVDEQNEIWWKIVDSDDFLKKVTSAVRIRRGMDSPTLVNHIAFSAGGSKNAATMAGAGAILEILIRGGALLDQGGLLVAAERSALKESDPNAVTKSLEPTIRAERFYGGGNPIATNLFSTSLASISRAKSNVEATLNINIQINCAPEEIEGLGAKIRKLLSDLDTQENSPTPGRYTFRQNDGE